MRYSTETVLIAIALLLLAGCAGTASAPVAGRVHHVVFCWLKEPGNAEARQQLIDATYRLREIPGVVSVSAGVVMKTPRPEADTTYDVGLEIVLENADALRSYATHPIHQQAVAEVLRPLVARMVVYDYAEGMRGEEGMRDDG